MISADTPRQACRAAPCRDSPKVKFGQTDSRTLDGSQGSVEIPAPPVGGTRIDYYVQAFDDRNNTVMENGSANMPRSAFVETAAEKPPAAESKSILSSPIFWAVAGAVVVGGGVGTYFALQPSPATTARMPISTSP